MQTKFQIGNLVIAGRDSPPVVTFEDTSILAEVDGIHIQRGTSTEYDVVKLLLGIYRRGTAWEAREEDLTLLTAAMVNRHFEEKIGAMREEINELDKEWGQLIRLVEKHNGETEVD